MHSNDALIVPHLVPSHHRCSIANFTDVAATFKGIIQAFREKADALKASKMKIFVRRGARLPMWHTSGAVWGPRHLPAC